MGRHAGGCMNAWSEVCSCGVVTDASGHAMGRDEHLVSSSDEIVGRRWLAAELELMCMH